MKGRVAVVTGASAGIGLATAEALAAKGATVVLACRDRGRAEAARSQIVSATGGDVHALDLDLASMRSTRAFADELQRRFQHLHVLVHNAGVVHPRRTRTEDGFEGQMAVTYLGPFLLTELLLPLLKRSAPARIVNVASDLHRGASLDPDDLQGEQRRYNFISFYGRAELAKILHTYELARRLAGTGVTANALHPGGVRTRLFREFRGPLGWLIALSSLLKKSPRSGARTSVFLASAPEVETASGGYYVNEKARRSSKTTYDEALARRLHEVSARLVGLG